MQLDDDLEFAKKVFNPNKAFAKQARIKNMCEYKDLVHEANEDYEHFWGELATQKLTWFKPFDKVLNSDNAPFFKWFENGKINVSYNCIDRHLKDKKNKVAIIFEGEMGDYNVITYRKLHSEVNKTANLLKNEFNVKKGDRVIIYMPMIVESVYMMLACARIGAIHSIVFAGFSPEALRDRINDAQAKLVITADGTFRKGKPYMLKPALDKALENNACPSVEKALIVIRNAKEIDYVRGRDFVYNEMVNYQSDKCEPEMMDSEDPLFLLYTSGSTGKPKGVQHSSAGYLLWAQMTMEWVFDIRDNDNFWCTADIGWITGHTYVVYGPLACGATTLILEGTMSYPDYGRWWRMIEEYRVDKFYTSPTAIRMLHAKGENEPLKYNLDSLKVLGTVGEPINPTAWKWFYEKIGNSKCSIVDTWWQTETGGHIISPLPGATPIRASCATLPLPGIHAEVLNEDGTKTKPGEQGFLCITKPWPSMIRNIWGDEKRYIDSYFSQIKLNGEYVYLSGDGAIVDENGYITIIGRTDDIVNVSGHRIGTAEVESAISKHEMVAECAVVGIPDTIKGEGLFAFVVLCDGAKCNLGESLELLKEMNHILSIEIGKIAKLDNVMYVPGLPKTRSGKIMRRLLKSIAKKEPITQDLSTLEDVNVVKEIMSIVQMEE